MQGIRLTAKADRSRKKNSGSQTGRSTVNKMYQLGKDWWKEVGRRFVDRGECDRGAVLEWMSSGETVLPVDRDQVVEGEDGQQQPCTDWSSSSSSPRPNGYAGIAAAGGMP